MNLTPPYDRYIVDMLPPREQVTAGGLILAAKPEEYLDHISEPGRRQDLTPHEERKGEVREFRVLARGPGLFTDSGVRQPMQYEVGQEILALRPMEMDGFDWMGGRYYVLAESAVIAGLDATTERGLIEACYEKQYGVPFNPTIPHETHPRCPCSSCVTYRYEGGRGAKQLNGGLK